YEAKQGVVNLEINVASLNESILNLNSPSDDFSLKENSKKLIVIDESITGYERFYCSIGGEIGLVHEFVRGRSTDVAESENKSWRFWRQNRVWKSVMSMTWVNADEESSINPEIINIPRAVYDKNNKRLLPISRFRYRLYKDKVDLTFKIYSENGKSNIAFMSSQSGSKDVVIKSHLDEKVVNIRSEKNQIIICEINVPIGESTISVNVGSGYAAIIGAHYQASSEQNNNNVIDFSLYISEDELYQNHGASDYAIRGANGLWAGSYHGGEYDVQSPVFLTDSGVSNDIGFCVTKKFTIIQNTLLKYSDDSIISINSMTTLGDSEYLMQASLESNDFYAKDAYLGMTCTSNQFKTVLFPTYIDDISLAGINNIGLSNCVVQLNKSSGDSVKTYFSKKPFVATVRNGMSIVYNASYSKVYDAFIASRTEELLPSALSWSTKREYL
ncbi:hypothetical protein DC081_10900, partial [Ignatzschineria cameli]